MALDDAQDEVDAARKALEQLEGAQWYVLDRETLASYVNYRNDAARIANLAQLLPAVFFVVAALVSLTAMTRMVEEQRQQVGILKALGSTDGRNLAPLSPLRAVAHGQRRDRGRADRGKTAPTGHHAHILDALHGIGRMPLALRLGARRVGRGRRRCEYTRSQRAGLPANLPGKSRTYPASRTAARRKAGLSGAGLRGCGGGCPLLTRRRCAISCATKSAFL